MEQERQLAAQLEAIFEDLIGYQRRRVVEAARRLNPRLTDDDLLNPQDYPELAGNAPWNYEDGILAGYLSALAAMRAKLRGG